MEPLDQKRQELLNTKLGRLNGWDPPNLLPAIGPSDPCVFEEFTAKIEDFAEHCAERLRSYSDADIEVLATGTEADLNDLQTDWDQFMRSEFRQLEKAKPPWFAGGFGHPDYQADLAHWARMSHFMLSEVACLSVGVDPKHFPYSKLVGFAKEKEPEKLWPAIVFLRDRYELLVRQFGRGWDSERRVDAWDFVDWAIRVELEMPDDFLALLKRYHLLELTTTAAGDGKPRRQDKREIDKIAQLFTAMAIDVYGYRPDAERSSVTKDIADLAASMGMQIHTDTVLKYLRRGAEYIDADWIGGKRSSDKE